MDWSLTFSDCRHGYEFLLLERQEFIRALYNGLPSREPIKTGCAVKGITESEDGARVFLEDESYEDGDMVVGCDGVASSVRQIMWDNANKAVPNTISTREMTCKLMVAYLHLLTFRLRHQILLLIFYSFENMLQVFGRA